MPMRIYVDFNTMTLGSRERVIINTEMQKDLVACLRPGLSVVFYDEEMEVEGMVEFDEAHQVWLGRPIWATRRDLPAPSSKMA
ncbi:MAG TPA: hypothetical protein VGX03_03175 [Candidatus Binatia bacterium]|jgi:hypothetical protein|nr:hypothetical protein [Candidatus Binatia bacterium]